MNGSTEHQLRGLFAADAAAAPDGLDLAAGALHRVRRRRRTRAVLATTAAAIVAVGAYAAYRPGRPAPSPQAQPPAVSASARPAALLPDGVDPGDPLAAGGANSCVKEYSPATLAEKAFAFDGTVAAVGPARTGRGAEPGGLDLRSVTFQVHTWFNGGSGDTAVVDMTAPGNSTSAASPACRIGTRLLVSGMPRRGGAPLDDPIAWGCGFTRYHSPATAAAWAAATR